MMDLLIRGGMVVDGTGAAGWRADVLISDGRISAIGGIRGCGACEIDAGGLVVAPDVIDIYTHDNAQDTWDPVVERSAGARPGQVLREFDA